MTGALQNQLLGMCGSVIRSLLMTKNHKKTKSETIVIKIKLSPDVYAMFAEFSRGKGVQRAVRNCLQDCINSRDAAVDWVNAQRENGKPTN